MKGFIVYNESMAGVTSVLRRSNSLWKKVPRGGVLRMGSMTVTVFPSREIARQAIERTVAYDEPRLNVDGEQEYSVLKLERWVEA